MQEIAHEARVRVRANLVLKMQTKIGKIKRKQTGHTVLLKLDIVQRQGNIINVKIQGTKKKTFERKLRFEIKQCTKHYIMRKYWFLGKRISSCFLPINRNVTIFFNCVIQRIFARINRTDQFKYTSTHRPKVFGLHIRIHKDSQVP